MEWTQEFRETKKQGKEVSLSVLECLRHADLITDVRETMTSTEFSCLTTWELFLDDSPNVASFFFSLSICQPIPAAAKKLTIRKAAAYRCDKLVDVRTVKCMKIEKADLKREKRRAALRARFTI